LCFQSAGQEAEGKQIADIPDDFDWAVAAAG